ncbi:MAG TPA: polysaccharide deacetylase family protein, partial [Calditrichia bacterium]|nr:polysaccharide deacetylase family protein [Calditrichia bacterium]
LDQLDYDGHVIGNHSFHHIPHFGIRGRHLAREIDATDRIILTEFGRLARVFRPPYGIFGRALFPVLKSTGKTMVLWTVMAYDFKWSSGKILDHLRKNVRPGDIVVFHDSPQTQEVLMNIIPPFVEYCRSRNWKFGSGEQLHVH